MLLFCVSLLYRRFEIHASAWEGAAYTVFFQNFHDAQVEFFPGLQVDRHVGGFGVTHDADVQGAVAKFKKIHVNAIVVDLIQLYAKLAYLGADRLQLFSGGAVGDA